MYFCRRYEKKYIFIIAVVFYGSKFCLSGLFGCSYRFVS